jgi:hypothetical protein
MLDAICCALLLKLNAEAAANRVAVGVGVTGEAVGVILIIVY